MWARIESRSSRRCPTSVAGKPGEYLLEATGKDAQGHDVLTSISFEVAGPGETVWNYRNPYAIDLVTDKESYEPGQTATILVKTPIAGDALVTVERDRVLRSFVIAPQRQRAFHPGADHGNGRAECFRLGHASARRE